MIERLDALATQIAAARQSIPQIRDSQAGLSIGSIFDIITEAITIMRAIFTHEPPSPPATPAASSATDGGQ